MAVGPLGPPDSGPPNLEAGITGMSATRIDISGSATLDSSLECLGTDIVALNDGTRTMPAGDSGLG